MRGLPAEIEVINAGDSTRVVLPWRARTAPAWVGLFPIGFGLIFAGFAVFWFLEALEMFPAAAPPVFEGGPEAPGPEARDVPAGPAPGFNWWNIFPAMFGLPFLIAGLFPIFAGILLFFRNRAEIVISPRELVAVERAGPLRFSRKRSLGSITGIRVGRSAVSSKGAPVLPAYGLFADGAPGGAGTGKTAALRLAQRYPLEMIAPLAHYLVEEIQRHRALGALTVEGTAGGSPSLGVTMDPDPEPAAADVPPAMEEPLPEQPAESKITLLRTGESLTFMVPATGFRSPTPFFFVMFSLFWNGITFCVGAGFVVALISEPSLENLLALGFISIFVAVGVGMALAAVQTARRKAVLLATRESLVFTQTGPIRSMEHHWAPGEIRRIRVGNSGTKVNNRPLQQLQVFGKDAHEGLLTGREPEELEWMAAQLRAFYHVGAG